MTETASTEPHCRAINIRTEAIAKNTVAVLHATCSLEERQNIFSLYQKALVSPICCLLRISNIDSDEITIEVGQEHFLEEFRHNIWVTSASDQ